MLLKVLGFICSLSSLLWAFLFWRLIGLGRGLTFINVLLAIQFLIGTFTSFFCSLALFNLGSSQLFEYHVDINSCKLYLTIYLVAYTLAGYLNLGSIFCRFIYVRYAQGLIKDKGKLFHQLVLVMITFFSLHWVLIWPIRTVLSNESYRTLIKGKICQQIPISELSQKDLRGKLATTAVLILGTLALMYMSNTSLKRKTGCSIPKVRRNVISFEQHAFYSRLYAFLLIFDQLVINTFCQSFSTVIGTHSVFVFWWVWNLIMFIFLFILTPIIWIFWALRDFPEFTNLRGRRYPGQELPRLQPILPYRNFTIEHTPRREDEMAEKRRIRKSKHNQTTLLVGLTDEIGISSLTEIVVT